MKVVTVTEVLEEKGDFGLVGVASCELPDSFYFERSFS